MEELKEKKTFSLDELNKILDPDKIKCLIRETSEDPWQLMDFPFFFEYTAERKILFLTGMKNNPRASVANLLMKAYREDDLVSLRMVFFMVNPRSDQGYILAHIVDKVNEKEDFVEFMVEGMGMYYLPASGSRAGLFNSAKKILANTSFKETDKFEEE